MLVHLCVCMSVLTSMHLCVLSVCVRKRDLVRLRVRAGGGGGRGPEREKTENLMVVSWPFPCSKQHYTQESKAAFCEVCAHCIEMIIILIKLS